MSILSNIMGNAGGSSSSESSEAGWSEDGTNQGNNQSQGFNSSNGQNNGQNNDGGQGNAGQGNGDNSGNGNENSGKYNSLETDIWSNKAKSESDSSKSNQNSGTPADPGKQLDDYMKSFDFGQQLETPFFDGDNAEELQAFQKYNSELGKEVYKKALLDANKLMDSRLESFKETILTESSQQQEQTMAEKSMFDQAPILQSAAMSPIAKATLSKMMEDHPPTEAIKKTVQMFKDFVQGGAAEFDLDQFTDKSRGSKSNISGADFTDILNP